MFIDACAQKKKSLESLRSRQESGQQSLLFYSNVHIFIVSCSCFYGILEMHWKHSMFPFSFVLVALIEEESVRHRLH